MLLLAITEEDPIWEAGAMTDIEFINTNTRTEITMWYSIHGAPTMEYGLVGKSKVFAPTAAKFIFTDGDISDVTLTVHQIKKDGSLSDKYQTMPGIFHWNQEDWPQWLRDLRDRVLADYAADRREFGPTVSRVS